MKLEIKRMCKMEIVKVIPVIIGALGAVSKDFNKWMEKMELDLTVKMLQKACLLGTARILRKVFDKN